MKVRLKRGIELGILMDALLCAYRDKDKRDLIPSIKNKIAQRLENAGLSFEEVESFIKTIERWAQRIIEKEV
jgi:hypothetical protein